MHTGLDHRLDPDAEAQRRAMAQRLRELSPELRPPFGWAELQERSRMRRRMGPSPSRVSWAAAAVAACVTLMLALAAQLHALQRERARMIDSLARVRYAEMLAAELP